MNCPKCGGTNIEQTLLGLIGAPPPPHLHEPNRHKCHGCKHVWWPVCPKCGWTRKPDADKEAGR